jgi:dienelactone hydrolase
VYEPSEGVVVEDLTYPGDDGLPVEAYLVRPAADTSGTSGPAAGLLAWHWFDTGAPDGDRTQFLEEADELAHAGVITLLPQGRFPWHEAPVRAADDLARIRAEVGRLRHGLDLLAGWPDVDADRLAVVGHDFGGMLAAVAAAEETRLRSITLIAATPRWGDWFLPFWPIQDDRLDYLRALRSVDPIECIGAAGPAEVLFQFGRQDFFIAPMTGLEFQGGAPAGSQLIPYDDDHGMRRPEVRADRRAFLARTLELPDAPAPTA